MSKRLMEPSVEKSGTGKARMVTGRKLPSKSRDQMLRRTKSGQDEAWKYDLPAYQFRTKSGKQMQAPIMDDTLIGGFSRMGSLSEEEARHQNEKLKEQEEARKKAEEKARRRFYNPFDGFDDAFQDDEDALL